MRRDQLLFLEFREQWNGVAVIPSREPTQCTLVDACLTGVGATDGQWAYGQQILDVADERYSITELEAINIVVALHSFINTADRGGHVLVRCDNLAAVQALSSGRARNPILQECARAAWMVQAIMDVEVSFNHIPGIDNDVADALSRAHVGVTHATRASTLVSHYSLSCVVPCLYFMDNDLVSLPCRSGAGSTPGPGGRPSAECKGPRDAGKPSSSGINICGLHGQGRGRSQVPNTPANLRVYGVHGSLHPCSSHHSQQTLSCQDVFASGGGPSCGAGSPPSQNGHCGLLPRQDLWTPCQCRTL